MSIVGIAAVLLASSALAANPYGYTGRSWDEPPLREVLAQADLVAECRVLVGGQFRAIVRPLRHFKGRVEGAITVEGFNSYEWNTAYYTMRAGDTLVLALFKAGETYTLATPSSGRFPVEKGCVLARLGEAEFLVEIPADDFRAGVDAYFLQDAADAARRLGEMLASDSLETRYLAIVLLGELRPETREIVAGLLAPLARDRNPAVREAAARSLGRAGGAEAARVLATFLTDADLAVAGAAAEAVAAAKSPGAGRELVAWLSRVAVQEEIEAEQKDAAAGGATQDDYRVQAEAFQFLADGEWLEGASDEERSAVTRGLVEMIASGGRGRATLAARVLGRLGAKEAVPELIRLLGAESERLRDEAGAALVAITLTPEAATRSRALRWWRRHKDEPRRKWVEQGLGRAADALRSGTYDGDAEGRLLVAVSRDPLAAWAVRTKLAEGTGWDEAPLDYMKGPLVAPFAERALATGTTSRRLAGATALAGLAEDFPSRTFLSAMLLASYDSDSEVRAKGVEALGKLGDTNMSGRLIDLMEYGSGKSEKEAAAKALRDLTGHRFGFYVSRGYDLVEELNGLELWRKWWRVDMEGGRKFTFRTSGGRTSTDALEDRLADTDAQVWLSYSQMLFRNAVKREVVERALGSDNARIRAILAASLGLSGRRDQAELLVPFLDDPEPFVRVQAAWALGNCLRRKGQPPRRLIEIAREALPETKQVEEEGADGDNEGADEEPDAEEPGTEKQGPEEPKGNDPPDRDPFADDADPPPSVVDPWAGFDFEKAEPPVKVLPAITLAALGKIGGADALDVLREAARSESSDLRREATAALAHFPGESADELLLEAVGRTSSSLRAIAARALAMRRPPGATEAIAAAIAEVDYWDSYTLMDTLLHVARPEDAGALAAHLTPENETPCVAAAYALTRSPGREAAEGLVNALENGGTTVRYYASRALAELGRKGPYESGLMADLRVRATKALVKQLAEPEALSASYAAQALEHVGVPGLPGTADALFVYRRAWKPQDPRAMGAILRLAGERGLRYSLGLLKDGTWSDKYYVLQALHYEPTPEAVAKLVEFWRDPESPFQAVAERSLRACGMAAVEVVGKLLKGEDAGLRRRAVLVMGGIGRDAVTPDVVSAVTAHLVALVDSADAVLAWLAEGELAALTGGEASLDADSTEDARLDAAARWRRFLGERGDVGTGGDTGGDAGGGAGGRR
jgi:HEAT repeat protein